MPKRPRYRAHTASSGAASSSRQARAASRSAPDTGRRATQGASNCYWRASRSRHSPAGTNQRPTMFMFVGGLVSTGLRLALSRHALLFHGLEDVRYGVVSVRELVSASRALVIT